MTNRHLEYLGNIEQDTDAQDIAVNTIEYRKCLNNQVFELLSSLRTISAEPIDKVFSGTKYRISSVDGKTYTIKPFANKLWDLIMLKFTELIHYNIKKKSYDWDDDERMRIYLSVQTIAECLGLSDSVNSMTQLYNRIANAAEILQNINITINHIQIDGYLECVAVRDYSNTQGEHITKSNAIFLFIINPALIEYIRFQSVGLYHFNHRWLHMTGQCQNTYAAAKRFGRHYSQNTNKRKNEKNIDTTMDLGTLRNYLPCLHNKSDKDNRVALDNALKSIPNATVTYTFRNKEITFDELKKLQLHKDQFNRVRVDVKFDKHPNTSNNRVTDDLIRQMNEDSFYYVSSFYYLEDTNHAINHSGCIKKRDTETQELTYQIKESTTE